MSDTDNWQNVNKKGDVFSVSSKLSEYTINPDWVDGYKALSNPEIQSDYKFFWKTMSATCDDIGSEIYKKIENYIGNISDIDTCEIHSLQDFAKLYGYNEDLTYSNFSFPVEILNIINIFSLNKECLYGANSVLTTETRNTLSSFITSSFYLSSSTGWDESTSTTIPSYVTDILQNRDDSSYIPYIKSVFFNTLSSFCQMKYRDDEDIHESKNIYEKNFVRFSTDLFKADKESTKDILFKKIKLNVPTYFPERKYVDDIIKNLKKMTDFTVAEQQILQMELDRRAENRNKQNNLSRYSQERENKVLEYFRFILTFLDEPFTTAIYNVNTNKDLITGSNNTTLITQDFQTKAVEFDYTVLDSVATKLTNMCLKLSYIRERLKTQAQKFYMSGTENIIVSSIRELLYTSIYNKDNNWRYILSGSNTPIEANDNLKIELIEYIDPTEYFNIATTSGETVSAGDGDSGLNIRYWENEDSYNGDITDEEILQFYNKVGLGNLFTQTYHVSSISGSASDGTELSAYSLSGFLATIFNAGATSATSSTFYQTLTGISNTYTPMPSSGWSSVTYGLDVSGNGKYISSNNVSGLYNSTDGISWSKLTVSPEEGWTSVVYGNDRRLFVAVNQSSGIYYSPDGVSWTKETTTGVNSGWIKVIYGTAEKLYMALNSTLGVYYSSDGMNWTAVSNLPLHNWSDITYHKGGGQYKYVATNLVTGLYNSTGSSTTPSLSVWAQSSSSDSTKIPGWMFITAGLSSASPAVTGFIGYNTLSGLCYMTNPSSGFTMSTGTCNTDWTSMVYGANVNNVERYVGTRINSNITYSTNNSGTGWSNTGDQYYNGWSNISYANNKFFAQNSIAKSLMYSTIGSGDWYTTSGSFLTSAIVALSADSTSAIFNKYSGIPSIGNIPFTNMKNMTHSSYQLHPFLKAFKQYVKTVRGIKNLFEFTLANLTTNYESISTKIDDYGNSINYWMEDNFDFTGYSSQYEFISKSKNNPCIGIDSPFNLNALSAYIYDTVNFIEDVADGTNYYYDHLGLTPEERTRISNQLNLFKSNTCQLSSYQIYKYGKDTYGNVYTLYKPTGDETAKGQLWIRYKDHPISLPAFVMGDDAQYAQIPNIDMDTIDNVMLSGYTTDINPSVSSFNYFNGFYDLGFTKDRDIMFLDYKTDDVGAVNTMLGIITNESIDLFGNKILGYSKETVHNFETINNSYIKDYVHIDTIISKKDIYFVYATNNYSINKTIAVRILKYNKRDGITIPSDYIVPVDYSPVETDISKWKCTTSNNILTIAYVSKNIELDAYVGNYVCGYTNNIVGRVQFGDIDDINSKDGFEDGITVIRFDVSDGLPDFFKDVRYFYKHTDLGFYPQYHGQIGKNTFYSNPVIKDDISYNLQLFLKPNVVAYDMVYEQAFSTYPYAGGNMAVSALSSDNIEYDMNRIEYSELVAAGYAPPSELSAREAYLYSTSAFTLSDTSLSSEWFKWFKKYDLSGDINSLESLSAGVSLSADDINTLPPSAYVYHSAEQYYMKSLNKQYPTSTVSSNLGTNLVVYGFIDSIAKSQTDACKVAVESGNEIYYVPYNESVMKKASINDLTNTTDIPINVDGTNYNEFIASTKFMSGTTECVAMVSNSLSNSIIYGDFTGFNKSSFGNISSSATYSYNDINAYGDKLLVLPSTGDVILLMQQVTSGFTTSAIKINFIDVLYDVQKEWKGLASSDDGTFIIASAGKATGGLYISEDSGKTWADKTPAGPQRYRKVRCSSDGKYIMTYIEHDLRVINNNLYISQDYGNTWTTIVLAMPDVAWRVSWEDLAMSKDGKYMYACKKLVYSGVGSGIFFRSYDYGATFEETYVEFLNPYDHPYDDITISDSGQYVATCCNSGDIFISNDYGSYSQFGTATSWFNATSATLPQLNWENITSTSDGKTIIACASLSGVFKSSDYGITWADITSGTIASEKDYEKVVISDDASFISIICNNDYAYVYNTATATWSCTISSIANSQIWRELSISHDGINIIACDDGNNIYASTDSGITWIEKNILYSENILWRDVLNIGDEFLIAGDLSQIYKFNINNVNNNYSSSMMINSTMVLAPKNTTTIADTNVLKYNTDTNEITTINIGAYIDSVNTFNPTENLFSKIISINDQDDSVLLVPSNNKNIIIIENTLSDTPTIKSISLGNILTSDELLEGELFNNAFFYNDRLLITPFNASYILEVDRINLQVYKYITLPSYKKFSNSLKLSNNNIVLLPYSDEIAILAVDDVTTVAYIEIDEGYVMQISYYAMGDTMASVKGIIFTKLNDNIDVSNTQYIISDVLLPDYTDTAVIDYTYNNVLKKYSVELVNISKGQFRITRL